LRATAKQGHFNPLFDKYKPDIICLQETKCEPDQLPNEVRNYFGYNSYFAFSKIKKGYSGVAVYVKIKSNKSGENISAPEKVEYGFGINKFDDEGRTLVLYFKDFVLLNVYFPNGGGGPDRLQYKMEFYDEFLKFINKLHKSGKKIIFCGDVNTAHTEIDLARPKENVDNTGFLPMERAWIDEVIRAGYVDTFRNFYPDKKGAYTYWDMKTYARDRNIGWRIDYFFISNDLLKDVKKTEILDSYYGSDHCPIVLELK